MAIPDKALEKAGEALGTAAQNGGSLSQDPNAHWYDVWSNTGSGLMDRAKDGDIRYAITHAAPGVGAVDATYQMIKATARLDWFPTTAAEWKAKAAGVGDGMSQQWSALAESAQSVWDGKTPDGQPLTGLARVGAAIGMLTSLEQLITMPLGMIPFPAFPAVRILDMDIGLPHAHMHPPNLIPPNPVPIPLPSTGPIIPIPLLSGASKTLINGLPAARCGDLGLGIWCGGYFPMYEIFLGSCNVWIEGNRAGRVGVDITKHCILSSPKPSDPPLGPMFGFTVNCSSNVMIGGVPLPSLTSMAMGAAFKAAFKAGGKVLGAARKRLGKGAGVADQAPAPRSNTARPHGPPPLPHAKINPVRSPTAELLAAGVPAGQRRVISDITAGELLWLTQHTGDEWGVVVQKDGQLAIIHGTPYETPLKRGDHVLVHTHPRVPGDPGTGIAMPSPGDLSGTAADAVKNKWDYPEAVIGHDGNMRFFDKNGVLADPAGAMLPVAKDGTIDGLYNPGGNTGTGLVAIPPPMLNRPP